MRNSLAASFLVVATAGTLYGALGNPLVSSSQPAPQGAQSHSVPDINDLERQVLFARRQIVSGEFRIHLLQKDLDGAPPRALTSDISFWVDSGRTRVRQDVQQGGVRTVDCFGDAKYYSYSDEQPSGKQRTSLICSDRQSGSRSTRMIYHPLKLMFFPTWFATGESASLESFVAAPNREGVRVDRDSRNGLDTLKVSFTMPTGGGAAHVGYWIAPALGHSIIRMEHESRWGEHTYQHSVDAEISEFPGKLFFPKFVHHETIRDGRKTLEEDLSVTFASLNTPISDSVFSPVGIGLPKGAGVTVDRDARPHRWNGTEVVTLTDEQLLAEYRHAARPVGKSSRVPFLLISALLASLACLVMWNWDRRRKASGSATK